MTVDDVYLVGLADDGVGPEPGPGLPPQLDDGGVVLGQVHLHNRRSEYKLCAQFYARGKVNLPI